MEREGESSKYMLGNEFGDEIYVSFHIRDVLFEGSLTKIVLVKDHTHFIQLKKA